MNNKIIIGTDLLTNDCMNERFVVNKDDKDRAIDVLHSATDEWFDNDIDDPYCDWLKEALDKAGIEYELLEEGGTC